MKVGCQWVYKGRETMSIKGGGRGSNANGRRLQKVVRSCWWWFNVGDVSEDAV